MYWAYLVYEYKVYFSLYVLWYSSSYLSQLNSNFMVLKVSKMKNIIELLLAIIAGIVLIISLPFLMINDSTAVIKI